MATVSQIGPGQTYTSIATWLSHFVGGGWIAELHYDPSGSAEFSISSPIVFDQATTVTDYITMRPATGHGFKDNLGSGPLRYDATKGAALKSTTYSSGIFSIPVSTGSDYVKIQGLQLSCTGGGGNLFAVDNALAAGTHNELDSNIIESNPGTSSNSVITWRSGTSRNNVRVNRASTGDGVRLVYPVGAVFANDTDVRPSDLTAAGSAFNGLGTSGTASVINCAGFGYNAFATVGTITFSGSNNASDKTISFGTNNQASLTYADEFELTTGLGDFRLKAGSHLIGAGFTDTTDIPSGLDIMGTTRG